MYFSFKLQIQRNDESIFWLDMELKQQRYNYLSVPSEAEDLSPLRLQEDFVSDGFSPDLHPDADPAAGIFPAGTQHLTILTLSLLTFSLALKCVELQFF